MGGDISQNGAPYRDSAQCVQVRRVDGENVREHFRLRKGDAQPLGDCPVRMEDVRSESADKAADVEIFTPEQGRDLYFSKKTAAHIGENSAAIAKRLLAGWIKIGKPEDLDLAKFFPEPCAGIMGSQNRHRVTVSKLFAKMQDKTGWNRILFKARKSRGGDQDFFLRSCQGRLSSTVVSAAASRLIPQVFGTMNAATGYGTHTSRKAPEIFRNIFERRPP